MTMKRGFKMATKDKKSPFDDFVESKTEKSKTIDWESKKILWLTKVDELYNQIESWLSDWIKEKKISISKNETRTVVEEHIGKYEVPVMKISIGNEKIELNPVGTLIIGGRGRVDVKGSAGEVMLILLGRNDRPGVSVKVFTSEKEAEEDRKKRERETIPEPKPEELIWKYARKSPRLEYFELDKALLEEILMAVSGN